MESNGTDAKERINNLVAVTVALLAGFMAISKVKDDNICQAMEREKANELNAWSYYQSKSIKENLAELGREQLGGLSQTVSGDVKAQIDAHVARYDKEIARYAGEKVGIKADAEKLRETYNQLNKLDDQFDLSDASMSIAMAMLAVTALTAKRWLLIVSWAVGGVGVLFGLGGFLGWNLRPDWLVKLLS